MFESRLDAAESRFFLRQLEAIEAELTKEDYPELKYSTFIPTNTGFDPGAKKVVYQMLKEVGRAKVIGNKSQAIPRVDVYGVEYKADVVPLADSYGYDIYEIKGAAKAGVNLQSEKAMTAREAIFRELDEIAALGNTEYAIPGFCNNSSVTSANAANGAASTPQWSTKTADEMLTDLTVAAKAAPNATNSIEWPDSILLPTDAYTVGATTRVGDTGFNVLEYFLKNTPWITNIDTWYHLDSAGAASSGRLVAYSRNRRKVELKNPHGFEQLPPQEDGLEFVVIQHMSTAGITLRKPKSMYYLDKVS